MITRSRRSARQRFGIPHRGAIWCARVVGAALVSIGFLGIVSGPAIAEPSATYEVRPGDTLSGIAQEYGVSVSTVAESNGLSNPNMLKAGRVLTIATTGSAVSPLSFSTIIEAPYYSQFDGSQWAASDCGPTALAMALGGIGLSGQPLELRALANRQMHNTNPNSGTTWEALAYAAHQHGAVTSGLYRGRYYRSWTMTQLKQEVSQKHPVLLLVRYRAMPNHQHSRYSGDHYIVAVGFDRQGNLIYNDSAAAGDGSELILTPSELATAWGRTSVGLVRTAMALHR